MSKYIDLAPTIKRDQMRGPVTGLDGESYALKWLDEHPDQVPGRTITESEFYSIADDSYAAYRTRYQNDRDLLSRFGITVDPEPTSAEKLANDLEEWGMSRGAALNLAPWLVGQGWVADD